MADLFSVHGTMWGKMDFTQKRPMSPIIFKQKRLFTTELIILGSGFMQFEYKDWIPSMDMRSVSSRSHILSYHLHASPDYMDCGRETLQATT
jgi:hypothetical protein